MYVTDYTVVYHHSGGFGESSLPSQETEGFSNKL